MNKKLKKIIWILITCGVIGTIVVFGINGLVKGTTKNQIIKEFKHANNWNKPINN